MRDDLTTLLPHVGQLPPHLLPTTTDPVPTPETDVMRRVLAALRSWGAAPCAVCGVNPVTRPDRPRGTVDGRFCTDCIQDCLDDPRREHWCPVDTLGAAGG
ncbi:hypothetical protein [Saccharomonospora iraqiensis]|uniref:hypothetical protein n=1 Tax=Saccharomonospora iraqiensis TaxID=52698 RepID=UPI00022DF876|nr:hypothetical protein [Saccharomonospora iraqiensis]